MKVPYSFFSKRIKELVDINELSEKFFQLGHEHTIENKIFDFELTPNRGDCLSLSGLLRDLKTFYSIDINFEKNSKPVPAFNIDFKNKAQNDCPYISFLKIEIEKSEEVKVYKDYMEKYFTCLDNKKINFFTDVSNYISFELGQPTHCYDFSKLGSEITLERINTNNKFKTLLGDEIQLSGDNLLFSSDNTIINLAGVMGGHETKCDDHTHCALIECAYFKPESIIGKSLKYDLNSEAAHKFERSVNPMCQKDVLDRFITIVSDHVKVTNVEMTSFNYDKYIETELEIDINKINKILGTDIDITKYEKILKNLGFKFNSNIVVPSWRNDVLSQNDLAEEVARTIGYDNINQSKFIVNGFEECSKDQNKNQKKESKIIDYLVDHGFYESINFPFISDSSQSAIKLDNPIDSNKPFMRESIKDSLIENLLFNERRQKDSIKFFELSDVYSKKSDSIEKIRKLGVIASGRIDNNYTSFNKKIDIKYMQDIFSSYVKNFDETIKDIPRETLDTKTKSKILYFEINIDDINENIIKYESVVPKTENFVSYKKISEYPSIFRDLSFSIKDFNQIETLERLVQNYKNEILIESFIFDFFHNKKNKEIKIGFRFRFQSNKTLTDVEVDNVIDDIIDQCMNIKNISIPGL